MRTGDNRLRLLSGPCLNSMLRRLIGSSLNVSFPPLQGNFRGKPPSPKSSAFFLQAGSALEMFYCGCDLTSSKRTRQPNKTTYQQHTGILVLRVAAGFFCQGNQMIVDNVFSIWCGIKQNKKPTVKLLMWMRMVAMKDKHYNTTTNDSIS